MKSCTFQGKDFEYPIDDCEAAPKFQSRKSSYPQESTHNGSLKAVLASEKNQKDEELAKWDDLI
jgi:hypothetical protein